MKTAMILAAGRGSRLKPLTNNIPKALCLVHGIPLIEYHVNNLAKSGFTHIVINHAYLGGKIRQHLGCGDRFGVDIRYSPEPTGGLETGGGIVNALPLLGTEPFVTVNADIYTDFDFSRLHVAENSLANFVLVKKPAFRPHSDFGLSKDNRLSNDNKQYTYTGIACYRPALFEKLKPGRFSVAPLLSQLAEDQSASAEVFHGKWIDIGSPERLKQANA